MKNYYDELEVSKKASKEVIEKAYKVLAKKYHPDSTTESDRAAAEERFKAISEAYNTLSDDFKRKEYDKELEESSPTISYEEYEYVLNKNKDLEDEIDYLHDKMNNATASSSSSSESRSGFGSKYFGDSPRGYYNKFTDSFVNPRASNGSSYTDRSHFETSRTRAQRAAEQDYDDSGRKPKRTFYYSDSGKPASAFDYYVYRIKTIGGNFILGLLVFVAFLLMIRGLLMSSLGNKSNNNTVNNATQNETKYIYNEDEYEPYITNEDVVNSPANPLQDILNFLGGATGTNK
jgi:curved DNA-binding protein CbpA